MKIRIPKLNSEHCFSMFLILFWGKDILFNYATVVLRSIPYVKYTADYVLPLLILVCLLLSYRCFARNITWRDLGFCFVSIVVILVNLLVYAENEYFLSILGDFLLTVFPLYFIGLNINISKHWRVLYIISIINIWLFTLYYIIMDGNSGQADQSAYSSYMNRAYTLLPNLLIVFSGAIKRMNFVNIMTSVIGLLMLMMCGNRGSVLLVFAFLVIYILFVSERGKRGIVYAGTIVVCVFIYAFFDELVIGLTGLFLQFGLSTRILDRLMEGSFFQSSGRDLLAEELLAAIIERPILGYGIAGDHSLAGNYSHNFALELWISFGVILGSVLLIATAYILIRGWLKTSDRESKIFLLVLLCTGFFKLFLSSSFLLEGAFFLLLGVCVTQARQYK